MANTNVKRVKTSDLELKDRLVAIRRVTKVTKGGRHFSFAAIVVVGDENGVVGYGLGKANEVTTAISKGIDPYVYVSDRLISLYNVSFSAAYKRVCNVYRIIEKGYGLRLKNEFSKILGC